MIILDTNVLSALMRQPADERVIRWLDQQPRTSVWTSSITMLEIEFGIRVLAAGRRRALLIESFEALLEKIGHRVAPFDSSAAFEAAQLMAERQKRGVPGDLRDTMIAGIAVAHKAALATRNVRHFQDADIVVIDPWSI